MDVINSVSTTVLEYYINIYIYIHTVFMCIKAGLKYTQGSNIHRVVQQNERNKCLARAHLNVGYQSC